MNWMLENRLTALCESSRGGPDRPREIFQRLQFFARVLREAPPAATGEARLLWLDPQGAVMAAAMGADGLLIGRDLACDVALASPRVSRRHCVVRRVEEGAEIEDLGSSNGTLVNAVALSRGGKQPLRDGDVIEVGGVALGVCLP